MVRTTWWRWGLTAFWYDQWTSQLTNLYSLAWNVWWNTQRSCRTHPGWARRRLVVRDMRGVTCNLVFIIWCLLVIHFYGHVIHFCVCVRVVPEHMTKLRGGRCNSEVFWIWNKIIIWKKIITLLIDYNYRSLIFCCGCV